MARYRIRITFTGNPLDGNTLRINDALGASLFIFNFNTTGLGGNGVRIDTPFQATNYNLRESFRVNYNLSGFYNVLAGADVSDIEGEFPDGSPQLGGALPLNVNVSFTLLANPFSITSTVYQANADQCNKVDCLVTTDNPFNEVTSPVSATFPNTTSYLLTDLDRGRFYSVRLRDENGQTTSKGIITPSKLNLGFITVAVFNNTVTITDVLNAVDLEYSLDNTNWQTDNTFNNLGEGIYTLYIRDQFLCVIQTTFEILEGEDGVIVIPDPYFAYSKFNPIRMAKRVQWDEVTVYRNSLNTLSCEVIDDVRYSETQRFRSTDTVTIQLKSNYDDLTVVTSDDQQTIPLVLKSNNIGVKVSQDCKIISLGGTQYGVYFIDGATYDYDTGTDLNEPYILNGALPQYGRIGNIITIGAINYSIEDITFNEEIQVEQLIISSTSLTGITDAVVKAIYNIYNYEVYEASIPMLGRDTFEIEVSYDGQLQYKSETILIDDVSENLIHISWQMNFNTDYFFATGTIPFARLLIDTIKAGVKNESDSYETDDDSILIDTDNYEVDIFTFLPVTKEMARHIINWLSTQELNIRGVGYRKESIEMEPLERSNYYVITANLVVRGSSIYEDRIGTANQEIVELITTESDEFIKTQ